MHTKSLLVVNWVMRGWHVKLVFLRLPESTSFDAKEFESRNQIKLRSMIMFWGEQAYESM